MRPVYMQAYSLASINSWSYMGRRLKSGIFLVSRRTGRSMAANSLTLSLMQSSVKESAAVIVV